jgi:hypothetical protein
MQPYLWKEIPNEFCNSPAPRGSLYVLLASLLLAFDERRSVSTPEYDPCATSNDLLRRLVAKHAAKPMNYHPIAQSPDDLPNNQNAPVISMGPYLLESGQVTGTDSDGLRYCFNLVRSGTLGE